MNQRLIIRILGGVLGAVLLTESIYELVTQRISTYATIFIFMFMGLAFLVYAITGKSSIKELINK